MFVYDTKAARDSPRFDRARRPYKWPVAFDEKEFERLLACLFGDISMELQPAPPGRLVR